MRGFIVVLVLCGIYSSHSASVGFSESSPCANMADGSFLAVIDDCSGFLMCLKGETLRSSCGKTLHFDPVGKQCVEISASVCGKQVKEDQTVVEVETKPQIVELKPQEADAKSPPEEIEVQQAPLKLVVKPQPEEVEPQQVPLKIVLKPQPEEVEVQQIPLKPEVKPQPEEVEPQQVPLKIVLKPQPEEVKLQFQTPELTPLEVQPQPTELKPESNPQPEEEKLLQVVADSKPIESEQEESVAQPEQAKPQQAVALKDACTGQTVGTFIASRTNCHDYYVCLGNKMILKTCPNELHYNTDVRSCTIPSLANCVPEPESDAEVKEISAEEKSEQMIQTEGNVEVIEVPAEEKPLKTEKAEEKQETSEIVSVCSDKANGVMLPVPGSCTKFFACLQHDTYELSCAVGHFDPATNMCVMSKVSGCVEGEVASDLDVLIEPEELLAGDGEDSTLDSGNDAILVGNADVKLTKAGVVTDLDKSVEAQASLVNAATVIQTLVDDQSVDNTNTGLVSDGQDLEVDNTELGSSNSYTVSGGKLLVNEIIVPIKQSGLPVNKEEISPIDQLDIDVSSPEIVADAEAYPESTAGKASKGVSISNANVNIDVNNVSDTQNSVVDQDSSNTVGVQKLSIPADIEEANAAVVVAVVDDESTRMCVGVPSGTLFPRIGNCEEFLTCESGIAYIAACPDGLHYNALLKACDWPENAGCV